MQMLFVSSVEGCLFCLFWGACGNEIMWVFFVLRREGGGGAGLDSTAVVVFSRVSHIYGILSIRPIAVERVCCFSSCVARG